jgi:hypothetical protein
MRAQGWLNASFFNIPLMVINSKPLLDDSLKVSAPQAHDAVSFPGPDLRR